jgi:hypothetical protein
VETEFESDGRNASAQLSSPEEGFPTNVVQQVDIHQQKPISRFNFLQRPLLREWQRFQPKLIHRFEVLEQKRISRLVALHHRPIPQFAAFCSKLRWRLEALQHQRVLDLEVPQKQLVLPRGVLQENEIL